MTKNTLLIVENHSQMNDFLNQYLKKNYDIISTYSVKEAIEMFESNKNIDIILCDLDFPLVDGYQLIEYLKNTEFYQYLPILILSHQNTSQDKIKAFNMGINDYVCKPFHPEELKIRLNNLLHY